MALRRATAQWLQNSSRTMRLIPSFLIGHRWLALTIYLVLSVVLISGLSRNAIDESPESWFRAKDPKVVDHQRFRYLFGSDEYLVIMFSHPSGDVLSHAALGDLQQLEKSLQEKSRQKDSHLNRITRIRSIVSADYLEADSETLINRKFIGENLPATDERIEQLRQQALNHKEYPELYFTKDFKFGALVLQTDYGSKVVDSHSSETEELEFNFDEGDSDKKTAMLDSGQLPEFDKPSLHDYVPFLDEVHKVLQDQGWNLVDNGSFGTASEKEYMLVGTPWMIGFFGGIIYSEMGKFTLLSLGLIALACFLVLRSLPFVIWAMFLMFSSLLWTMGLIGWSGLTMSSMINVTVFLVITAGVASAIHILSGFKLNRTKGKHFSLALSDTYQTSGLPIVLAALTTIGGLLSLLSVPILHIQNFALQSSMGVFCALVQTLFLLPILLSFWTAKVKVDKDLREKFLQKSLMKVGELSYRHPYRVAAVFAVLAAVIGLGYKNIFIDTTIVNLIKPGHGFREAYTTIDENFGGASNVEIIVDAGRTGGIKDPEVLKAMESFQSYIESQHRDFVSDTYSVADIAKDSYRNITDGSEVNYRIPQDPNQLEQTLVLFDAADPKTRRLYVDDDWQRARISFKVYTHSSSEYLEFMKEVDRVLPRFFPGQLAVNQNFKSYSAGMIPLFMQLTDYISKSQLKSFATVIAVISLVLLCLYGSFKYGAIAIIPNLFPASVVLGLIGWSRTPLDSATLLVFPVVIGIAVDDTIHFLTCFRNRVMRGEDNRQAIHSTLSEVGQAIVLTSLILSVGFLIYYWSVYRTLTSFGLLSSVAIFGALLADLLLLPALIVIFDPFKNEKSEIRLNIKRSFEPIRTTGTVDRS